MPFAARNDDLEEAVTRKELHVLKELAMLERPMHPRRVELYARVDGRRRLVGADGSPY